jgi:hypothetical protein
MAIFRGTGSASATADQTTIDTVTEKATEAAASATAASTSATAAEASKTAAEALYGDLTAVNTAKTAAETAATNAETAQTAAEAAQSAAESAESNLTQAVSDVQDVYDNFDDRYLGVKTSDPTLDNDGDALLTGALYFNSTDNVMRVYDGTEWFTAYASLAGALVATNNLSELTNTATAISNLGITKTAAEINASLSSGDNISTLTNDSGYITGYTVTQGDVTAHQAALSITESQISDLQSYLTTETNDLTAAVTWANVPDANITQSSVTQHQAALSITESQISDFGTYEPVDADILRADTADTITAPMRGTVTTDNDLSFDMNASNFFKCTPTGNGTLTFTNITAGQSGNIWLDNSAGVVISAASSTYIASADLTTISTAGVYFLSYYSDGTNVMVSATPAVTSAGA